MSKTEEKDIYKYKDHDKHMTLLENSCKIVNISDS